MPDIDVGNLIYFLLKWFHFLAGITWIGVLYYFNFMQGAFFAETTPEVKTAATQKLVPRALWWFRWGAMFTIITGWIMIGYKIGHNGVPITDAWSVKILIGALMGTFMWANVWFVIWPAQKLAIAAANGQKIDGLADRVRRAFLASRTNTLLSIPMLFLMGAAANLKIRPQEPITWLIVAGAIVLLVEINALTATKGATTAPIEKVKGVITSGFVLTAVFFAVLLLV